MIKELINFTKNLDENLKNLAYKPSKGLHVLVSFNESQQIFLKGYIYYNGDDELSEELSAILLFERYSSYISMNQQGKFDKAKKIHSASPFSFAFNFSLGNSKDEIENQLKKEIENKTNTKFEDKSHSSEKRIEMNLLLNENIKKYKIEEVKKSVANYFSCAKRLCLTENEVEFEPQLIVFEQFCTDTLWQILPTMVMQKNISKKKEVQEFVEVPILPELKDKDYIRVYLESIPTKIWKIAYEKYYQGEYPINKYNENDFISVFPDKKPFMSHQTATFQTFKVNGIDAAILKQLKDIFSSKTKIISKPLPLFIYKDELQRNLISLYNENRTLSYSEIITALWQNHKEDFSNYYLIQWYKGDDIVFQDFEFVSKFEFEFDVQIENLFEISDKGNGLIHYPKIQNVFQLEKIVFGKLIGHKIYGNIDYFKELKDIKSNAYESMNLTYQSFTKYRKAVYDFVYKSKRQGIDEYIFTDMVFSHIKDDLKQNNGFSIREKLNIWFSLFEKFKHNNQENEVTMASQLKSYQKFVAQLSMGKVDVDNATDKEFAFAAGQVIDYLLGKSQAQDKSYQLLEPYLQQAKCQEFKRAIANDIARYKHAINDGETRFKSVCDFVLTYDTMVNMKELMPEILAGAFSKCQFFHKDEDKNNQLINV